MLPQAGLVPPQNLTRRLFALPNPGDGFGLLQNDRQPGYIEGLREQAQHALDAADATDEVKLHVGHVRVAGENVRVRLTGIRNHALHVVQASNLAATQPDLRTILALAEQAIQGMDMNLDELVGPIAGEGGIQTAYQHAQLMARITLTARATAAAPAPPSTERQQLTITITDHTFTPRFVTVQPGVTVVWHNQSRHPHTVTAANGDFDSQQIAPGGSFEQTFTEVGTVPYFCLWEGEKSGARMAGTIIVADPSAATALAPTPAAPQSSARAPATGADTVSVAIKDNTFAPSRMTVPVGATVIWTHQGRRTHTVTADDRAFRSPGLGGGTAFAQQFDRPGTYRYSCEIHGSAGGRGMTGEVIVSEPLNAASSPAAR